MTPEDVASKLTGIPVSVWKTKEYLDDSLLHLGRYQCMENEDDGKGGVTDGWETITQTYGEFLEEVRKMLVHFKLLEHG